MDLLQEWQLGARRLPAGLRRCPPGASESGGTRATLSCCIGTVTLRVQKVELCVGNRFSLSHWCHWYCSIIFRSSDQ